MWTLSSFHKWKDPEAQVGSVALGTNKRPTAKEVKIWDFRFPVQCCLRFLLTTDLIVN